MLGRIIADSDLEVTLSHIDFELAEEARTRGCPYCGGRLHSARFPRRPRCNRALLPGWQRRFSFCCASEGCRRRTTPQSVRFLGRCVYPAVVVVLMSALCSGVTSSRLRWLREKLSIDRRTLERWRKWWRETFPRTSFWKNAKARFLPPLDPDFLPRSLLLRFGTGSVEGIVALLRFIAPLSVRAP